MIRKQCHRVHLEAPSQSFKGSPAGTAEEPIRVLNFYIFNNISLKLDVVLFFLKAVLFYIK